MAAGRGTALTDDLLHLAPHRFERDAERFQGFGGDAFALVDETEKDVLGADVVVVEQTRFFLRQHHDSSSPIGEPFEHEALLPIGWQAWSARTSSVPTPLSFRPVAR